MEEKIRETYISIKNIEYIAQEFDLNSNTASEAGFDAFCMWRDFYDKKHEEKIGLYDIQSQVSMFDHDLNSLYYDETKIATLDKPK